MKRAILVMLSFACGLSCLAAHAQSPAAAPGAVAAKAATAAQVLFSADLKDAPGKKLVVVSLKFDPEGKSPARPHHHPGSVYVYVTKGVARLGLKGEPVQEVHAGQSFFEAPGSVHTVATSASKTEPAYAIAVMLVPDGAPLATPEAAGP